MKTRVLVTGGSGFIGSNFCNINKDKFEITALDNFFLGDRRNLDSDIRLIEGDACNMEDLDKVGPVDFILHLAGTSSAPMFDGDGLIWGYVNAVKSFVTVLEWARKNGVKKIGYASTSSLYGNNPMPLTEDQNVTPPNHYSVTKQVYEYCSQNFHRQYPEIQIVGFRFMSVYGPNEEAKGIYANVVTQFCWDVGRDLQPIVYGDGTQTRDFTNVRDVVQAITRYFECPKDLGCDVFNVGTGRAVTVNEILAAINKAFGKNIPTKYIPNPIKGIYIKGQHADISKIVNVLGFQPTVTLEEGIAEQVKGLRMDRIKGSSSDNFR